MSNKANRPARRVNLDAVFRTVHKMKVKNTNRAKNRVARKSRRINRNHRR